MNDKLCFCYVSMGCCGNCARYSHPGHTKARAHCAIPKIHPLHRSTLHTRQPALWLHYLCQEVLTVHGNELRLFGANAFPSPYPYYWYRATDIAAAGTIHNIYRDGIIWVDQRTHHLPNAERMRNVLKAKNSLNPLKDITKEYNKQWKQTREKIFIRV